MFGSDDPAAACSLDLPTRRRASPPGPAPRQRWWTAELADTTLAACGAKRQSPRFTTDRAHGVLVPRHRAALSEPGEEAHRPRSAARNRRHHGPGVCSHKAATCVARGPSAPCDDDPLRPHRDHLSTSSRAGSPSTTSTTSRVAACWNARCAPRRSGQTGISPSPARSAGRDPAAQGPGDDDGGRRPHPRHGRELRRRRASSPRGAPSTRQGRRTSRPPAAFTAPMPQREVRDT